ncbi:MAG: glycosyltransferase [Clostridiales bacterium]|nr:glycosyltransferase [Clostridiales bacterium]
MTVGRMTKEKGADLALEACRRLRAEGRKIIWHWVGDGNRAADIRKQADALGLSDSFLPEGNQENPYPFILAGDIYVQPSYYEAYSTTVTEAKVLHRPMVVTDVGGMRDQLVSGQNALIVPVDAAAIADAVRILLDDAAMRETFSKALEEEAYDAQATLKTYEASVFS